MRQAYIERKINSGVQKLFRFANDYGASVIKTKYSYGAEDGRWELAVIRYEKKDSLSFSIAYDTPTTNDVIGCLDQQQVDDILGKIEQLTVESA